MKGGELQRPNSLLCFLVCHVILMVHTDFQDGGQSEVVMRIARLFSRFVENRTTIYSKFYKERFPESCPVSPSINYGMDDRQKHRKERAFKRKIF